MALVVLNPGAGRGDLLPTQPCQPLPQTSPPPHLSSMGVQLRSNHTWGKKHPLPWQMPALSLSSP